jgi:nucleoid-associated protein Lsr2
MKMAQKVSVLLLCDLHDNSDTEAAETVSFSMGNTAYEIDVCTAHAKKLREKLQPYIEHGRRVRATTAPSRTRRSADRAHTAEVRAWAKEHGHQISERGRIPASVVAGYEQSH